MKLRLFGSEFVPRYWPIRGAAFDVELSLNAAVERFSARNTLYAYMHHYFWHRAPAFVREHRSYFKADQRGFGEDAFHSMWWLLFLQEKPARMLEIGIYRGQTVSLWALIAKVLGVECE